MQLSYSANGARHGRVRTPSDCHHTWGISGAEGIRDRALKQREASRTKNSHAKAACQKLARRIHMFKEDNKDYLRSVPAYAGTHDSDRAIHLDREYQTRTHFTFQVALG